MLRDMAKRCVSINLGRPEYLARWEEETIDFIEANRWAIIGDILAALTQPAPPLGTHSRWGTWEAAVLSRVGDPSACQKLIEERQDDVDDDATEADLVRERFLKELLAHNRQPDNAHVWIDCQMAARWCNEALGERRATQKATSYLETLAITELHRVRRSDLGGRGWIWRGCKVASGESAPEVLDLPPQNTTP